MPVEIDRDDLQRLLAEQHAQLVEVLPEQEYREEHLPGALHLPLDGLTRENASRLDRDRPVIVYCYDFACDQSPRAAARLESLGFKRVYDYVNGKADWAAAGLPLEGERAAVPRVGDIAHGEVPTCRLGDSVADVRRTLATSGWDTCFVVDEAGVVLGRIYVSKLGEDGETTVESVMDPGPVTYRPDTTVFEMLDLMRRADLETAAVTTADGRLVGLALRRDIEEIVEAVRREHERHARAHADAHQEHRSAVGGGVGA
jgi:rhodanese-related sulfurtransferase/CBS domain-containing protein